MAKGKHTTALFDVIHAAKKPPKSSPSASMPTPRWWAKDKKKLNEVPPPIGDTAGKQTSWLKKTAAPTPVRPSVQATAADRSDQQEPIEANHAESDYAQSTEISVAEPQPSVEYQPSSEPAVEPSQPAVTDNKPVTSVRWMSRAQPSVSASVAAAPDTDETPPLVAEMRTKFRDRARENSDDSTESPRSNGRRLNSAEPPVAVVDRESKEVSFRFSYAGLIGLAMVVVLAMTLAFIVGNRVSNLRSDAGKNAKPTGAGTTPTNNMSGLLSVSGPTKSITPATTTPPTVPAIRPDVADVKSHNPTPTISQTPTVPSVRTTPPIRATVYNPPVDNPRVVGRLYVLIKAYPDGEGDAAGQTAALLNANGIPCSVVRGFNVPENWYSVVGTQPFTVSDSPECIEYGRKILSLRPKFAGRHLQSQAEQRPKMLPWTADADQR